MFEDYIDVNEPDPATNEQDTGSQLPEDEKVDLRPGDKEAPGLQMNPKDPTSAVISTAVSPDAFGGITKPVCFENIGSVGATIMPWTYIPLNTESAIMPPIVSTTASPGSGSKGCMTLPLGEYSWCFYWELGDINDDGMIEYAHSLWLQRVILDESDPDDLDFAERITLSAPETLGQQPGPCELDAWNVLDIRPYIVESNHLDSFFYGFSVAGMAHNEDYVTLKGPITVEYYYHHCDAAPCTIPVIAEPPVRISIAEGQTYKFYLEDTVGEHLGNWDMYVQMISIDE
ncbi:MAG: hypothetical protein MUC85_12040 [Anaerolineales bacterium]|nr:hypothetical protein [Anaerolineales bacterium]